MKLGRRLPELKIREKHDSSVETKCCKIILNHTPWIIGLHVWSCLLKNTLIVSIKTDCFCLSLGPCQSLSVLYTLAKSVKRGLKLVYINLLGLHVSDSRVDRIHVCSVLQVKSRSATMAGRGRGVAAFTFNIEALGIGRGNMPEVRVGPSPLFPVSTHYSHTHTHNE